MKNLMLILLAASLFRLIAGTSGAAENYQAASTRRMADRLRQIVLQSDPMQNPFLNRRAAEMFEGQLRLALEQPDADPARFVGLRYRLAHELLHAGRSREAIEQFEALRKLIGEGRIELPEDKQTLLRMNTALAHLRLGEQENCLLNHTIDSCLMPIQPGGFHQKTLGSEGAITILKEQLARDPNDLQAGWLLNLAYMTLGAHPDGVPPFFLIPPRVFNSEYDLPRFPDRARGSGLDLNTLAGSAVMDDFDNDGNLDLMICSMGVEDPLRFFRNSADGHFEERTGPAGLTGELGGLNLVQADYNNDGYLDVLVLRGAWFEKQGHHPNSLLRNNGNGTFDDVTEEAGLLSFHPTQTATWLDFNNDGWIDLFIGNESVPGDVNPCELYRNNGDGTFQEIARASGLTGLGLIKSVHSGDYNNDGWTDIYVSCRGQANLLYRNEGKPADGTPWSFRNVAADLGVSDPVYSFPAWFFDYDNDGWLDLFACGYGVKSVASVAADYLGLRHGAALPRLYHNNGDGTFTNVTAEAGLNHLLVGMAGNFGDLDNDGFADLYIGTGSPDLTMLVPNRMFRNDSGRRFQDVTTSGGFGTVQKGHGICFGDLDNDGDQDVYTSIGGAYEGDTYFNALFENPGNENDWLKLRLVGSTSNRSAIGARIKVSVQTKTGSRSIHRTVNSGGTFGASPLRQEFGLGKTATVTGVEVFWPASGVRQHFAGLRKNRCYLIHENRKTPTEESLASFKLPLTHASHH
ncbi:MAG: FG-GAP-like repeat-containing protein [Verrucomicrobia bacterium]|nr:FG-GAP-like repeat-containing protein [Verrucomicrobiota bacterium]